MWHWSMGLTMRKICGELECPEYYMCQSHDLQCYPCHSYCNQSSNNFDAHICERQCQDYIHDFIKHYVKVEEIQDSLQEKEILQFLMICIVVLIVISLILISIMTVLVCNRKRFERTIENEGEISYSRKKTDFSKDNEVSIENETVNNSMTMIAAPTSYMTPSSSNKFPCEDITLETQDFTGYDNLGMWKVSPELCSKL